MASLSFLAARGIIGAGASLCRPRPRSGADVGAACMSALTANASDQEPPQQQQQQQQHPKKNKKMPTRAASGAKQRTGTLRGGTVRNAPEKDRIHKNERVKLVDDMFHPLPAPTGQVHGGEQFDRCIASFLKKIGPSLGVEMLSAEEDARLAAQDESKSEKPREKNDLKHRIMAAAEAGSLASMTRIWHEIISNEKMGNFIRLDLRSYQDMMGMFVEAPDVTPQSRVFQVYKRCCKQGSTPNAVMYNRYMRACAKLGDGDRARELILSLEDAPPENFSPSSSFLYNLIISLSRGGYSSDAQRYVELMKNLGHTGTPVVYQQYIWSWTRPDKATGKAPDLEKAVQAIDDMLAAELVPAPRLIAHVLMLAVRQEKAEHTLKLLRLLRGLKGQLAASECTILLHFAANDGNAVLTQEIWQATEEWGIERCPSMYNAVVVALANAGNISDALVALMDMISEGREVRNRTINSVAFRISTSVKRIDNMYYFLAHLKENGKKIPVEAINCIVLACSKRCQVDRTFSTAQAIEKIFGAKRDATTYAAMLRVLRWMEVPDNDRKMLLVTANSLVDDMRAEGIQPSDDTYYRLLELAVLVGDPDAITDITKEMEREGITANKGILMLLHRTFKRWGFDERAQKWEEKLEKWIRAHPYERSTRSGTCRISSNPTSSQSRTHPSPLESATSIIAKNSEG